LLGGFHLGAHERVQIKKDADREEGAAKAHKKQEGDWAVTKEAQALNDKAKNQDDSGKL